MPRNDRKDYAVARNADLRGDRVNAAQAHNERQKESYSNDDIVLDRIPLNVHFKNPTGGYAEMFDQMVQEGSISTRGLKADATHFCEMVLDVNSAYFFNHGGYEYAKKFYEDAYRAAVEIIGGEQYILSAVMHADEKNRAMSAALGQNVYHYHLHIVYVPVVEKQILWSKRCKDPALVGTVKETVMQVSRSKKWANQPILGSDGQQLKTRSGKPVFKKSYSVLQDDFYEHMKAAGYTDIERGERGSTEEHLSVTQFKVQREQERLAALQETIQQTEQDAKETAQELRLLTTKVSHAAEIARRFSDDPEKELPAAGAFESAKAYRENKAKPAWTKVVKVLRSVYGMYLSAVDEIRKLKDQLAREQRRGDALARRNAAMQEEVDEYTVVRRVLGQPVIDRALEQQRAAREARQKHRQTNIQQGGETR